MGENGAKGEGRPWTVAVICGASGVGKSTIGRALSVRYGVPLGDVDDMITAIKTITSPREQPLLHLWDTDSDTRTWSPARIADHHLAVTDVVLPAIRAVIADHLEFDAPVVLEGDYLAPELVVEFGAEVRAVVLDEPDAGQIAANMRAREPNWDHVDFRASVSVATGAMLAARARAIGVPVLRPSPWADGLERVEAALRNPVTVSGAGRRG
ncbi:MAG TPA: hypothetical protein VH333_26760 [Pseudonocardiaceae bacterium]|jgi:2-phosphoglycerate kinase|nr:hypothetical protein [Pseudonocardiaceae bacterium]